MRTSVFRYYNPPFREYNVAQAAVIPFLDKDMNLVVSFATAVGKTVLAECAFSYHLKTGEGKVAYVCPFRSIGSEKYEAWMDNNQLAPYGILLVTGDTNPTREDYEKANIVIFTSESFDSKTRSGNWEPFLSSLDCVVFDEAHLIGDKSRGGAVEASIVRFSSLNRNARLILLSATMTNSLEIAKWVKSLNDKETKCIKSDWRPTKVELDYVYVDGTNQRIDETVRLAVESKDMKTLVFVHSKPIGTQIVKRLRQLKIRSAFHNASVPANKRKRMEELFSDKMSGFNVLVSTSTLGAGVNLA